VGGNSVQALSGQGRPDRNTEIASQRYCWSLCVTIKKFYTLNQVSAVRLLVVASYMYNNPCMLTTWRYTNVGTLSDVFVGGIVGHHAVLSL
jgi:hypothetical protein